MSKRNKKIKTIKSNVDIDKALGAGARASYLEQNPHGYTSTHKVHKSKKSYTRKKKHKKSDY